MKKYLKSLLLYIPLSIVLVFLVMWGVSLLKCEIVTNKYCDELEYAHIENTMLDKINSFKVLKCDGNTAEVYYLCNDNTVGNVITFQKENDEWKEVSWECIWSKMGNADEMIWPYWHHTYFMNNKSAEFEDDFAAVLNSRLIFISDSGEAEYLKNFAYDGKGEYIAEPCRYAKVDFDGDGSDEAVVDIANGNAYVVLHNEDNCIYGYLFYSRSLQNIKQDGTFKGTAASDAIHYSTISFGKHSYKINNLASCDNGKYEIEGEPATKEAFDDYIEKQNMKKDVAWFSIEK